MIHTKLSINKLKWFIFLTNFEDYQNNLFDEEYTNVYLLDSLPLKRCTMHYVFYEAPSGRFIGEDIFIRVIFEMKTRFDKKSMQQNPGRDTVATRIKKKKLSEDNRNSCFQK